MIRDVFGGLERSAEGLRKEEREGTGLKCWRGERRELAMASREMHRPSTLFQRNLKKFALK